MPGTRYNLPGPVLTRDKPFLASPCPKGVYLLGMAIGVAYGEDTQKEKEVCTMVLPPCLPYLSEGSLSCPSLISELPPLFLALWTLPALFPGSLVGIQSDCLTLGFVWGLLFLESNPVSGSRSQNSESSALSAFANCASSAGNHQHQLHDIAMGVPSCGGHNYYFQENCVPPNPKVLTCSPP